MTGFKVLSCMLADQVYSPFAERVKEHVGSEWEFHLARRLAGLQFKTEDELRSEVWSKHRRKFVLKKKKKKKNWQGFAKTPDVFFHIPHVVTIANGEEVVALWIDSKGCGKKKQILFCRLIALISDLH
jgi:hypothetical protein